MKMTRLVLQQNKTILQGLKQQNLRMTRIVLEEKTISQDLKRQNLRMLRLVLQQQKLQRGKPKSTYMASG